MCSMFEKENEVVQTEKVTFFKMQNDENDGRQCKQRLYADLPQA